MDFKRDVMVLQTMTPMELRIWLASFLKFGDSSPLDFRDIDRHPWQMLIIFVKEQIPREDFSLVERVKDAIAELAGGLSPHDPLHFDFFWDVLAVSSAIRAYGAQRVLLPIANRGAFRGKFGRGEDLHKCIIETLASLGLDETDASALVERDIYDPRYTETALKVLYRANPGRLNQYLPIAVASMMTGEDPVTDLHFLLEDILEQMGEHAVTAALPSVVRHLKTGERIDMVLEALVRAERKAAREIMANVALELMRQGCRVQNPYAIPALWKGPQRAALVMDGDLHAVLTNEVFVEVVQERQEWEEWLRLVTWPLTFGHTSQLIRTSEVMTHDE